MRSLHPYLLTAVVAALALGGTVGCEKHPVGEPAEGYGHGSAHPGSKAGDMHGPDGTNTRFSDSQGTNVAAPDHQGGAAGGATESETHASGPEHGRPGPGGQHDPEQKEK